MRAIVKSYIQFVCIFLLITLSCTKAYAEPMEPLLSKDALNRLIIQVDKSKADKNLVNNLLDIALYYLFKEDKKSEKYINKALSLSEKLSYNDGLVKSMCLQATFLQTIENDTVSANNVIERAISLSKKKNLPAMEAYAYYTKGEWSSISNLKVAQEYYTKARNLYKSSSNKVNEAFVVKCIANTHLYQNKLSQSILQYCML